MRSPILTVITLGLSAVMVLSACGTQSGPAWTFAPGALAVAPADDAVAAPSGTATGKAVDAIDIESFDLGFKPADITVEAQGTYTVNLTNTGAIVHNVVTPSGDKVEALGGKEAAGTIEVPAAGTTFICDIPGHADAGMKGTIKVAGSTGTGAEASAPEGHGGALPTSDIAADPAAPAYTLHDAKAPALAAGTVHDIDLVIEEKEMTVADGFVQKVWTFGGTVPGPVIRVKVGDTVRIHLKNPTTSVVPHSIDFHSSLVAWNDEMTSINPGEEKLYEWTAEYAGVWMYHCGTAPALHHIANGMYGMVIVEPKDGLPAVDSEFAIVQSEWYMGRQGEPASLAKANVAVPAPDLVMFNGVANQYKDNPIAIATGERVRVFVLNAGPSIDSSFHVVGTMFDTVIKEGVELKRGNSGNWGSQSVDLAPAQGAIVEFEMAEDGLYPFVTHAFNFVDRGALGLFKAGDGDPRN